jgi:hypothetical protein
MIEGNKEFQENDLSEFSDYLSQFDNAVRFDAEVCPVCGVTVSESLTIKKSPYIKLSTLKDKASVLEIANQLELIGITVKIVEVIDNSVLDRINYLYQIFVPIKDSKKAGKLILELTKS